MANMNIGSANAGDAFYRYKMPRLEAKIEGRGNGIKTNIVNLVDISKCLGRPPQCTSADQQRKGLGWDALLSLFSFGDANPSPSSILLLVSNDRERSEKRHVHVRRHCYA